MNFGLLIEEICGFGVCVDLCLGDIIIVVISKGVIIEVKMVD